MSEERFELKRSWKIAVVGIYLGLAVLPLIHFTRILESSRLDELYALVFIWVVWLVLAFSGWLVCVRAQVKSYAIIDDRCLILHVYDVRVGWRDIRIEIDEVASIRAGRLRSPKLYLKDGQVFFLANYVDPKGNRLLVSLSRILDGGTR
ncbi:MAG: hypothetical protein HY897_07615 [Deltaproteobacteria bacterium]|nr:hypothetical protein [Deltaproteobacteria bacterium]